MEEQKVHEVREIHAPESLEDIRRYILKKFEQRIKLEIASAVDTVLMPKIASAVDTVLKEEGMALVNSKLSENWITGILIK